MGYAIAAIQMVSSASVEENLATARRLIEQAAAHGAQLILLPEYWPVMGLKDTDKLALAEQFHTGPIQQALAQIARRYGLWLIGGTLPMATVAGSNEIGKIRNTTLVYDPEGNCVKRYDKIHLFSFATGEESYDEARTIAPGIDIATVDTPCGRVGLSVCYDLRFPELYRAMGPCNLIVVPAAFTWTTGQAHWEVLLRARAIENQCYVLAAAQGGRHQNGRRTWGHSMLIDPWGKVLMQLPEGEGVVSGVIDPALLDDVRASLPALQHRRL